MDGLTIQKYALCERICERRAAGNNIHQGVRKRVEFRRVRPGGIVDHLPQELQLLRQMPQEVSGEAKWPGAQITL